MPITDTLQNSKRLEALGFDHEKSQGISEILEDAIQAGQQDLKEFIRAELQGVFGKMNSIESKLDSVKSELRAELNSVKSKLDSVESGLKAELNSVNSELNSVKSELNSVKNELRAEFHMSLRDQLLKFVAIMAMMISLAVAVIKLFPGP